MCHEDHEPSHRQRREDCLEAIRTWTCRHVYSVYSDVKVPKPICTLTPNDVLAQVYIVYMSTRAFLHLSTFTNRI